MQEEKFLSFGQKPILLLLLTRHLRCINSKSITESRKLCFLLIDYMGNIFFIFFLCTAPFAAAQNVATPADPPPPPVMPLADTSLDQFRPGIAITVGIFTTIFSITFLVLLYVKHCRKDMYTTHSSVDHHYHHHHHHQKSGGGGGVDIKVIQALPIFRFSSLRGQKEGLECAVCLNPFEPDEVMRLLPKCKHAFHVECVDVWLEANPTCPLCRYRVDPEDVLLVDTKSLFNFREKATPRSSEQGRFGSGRVSGRHSSAGPLEIIIEKSKADDVAAASQRRASLDSWSSKKKTGSGNRGKSFEGSGRRSSSSRRDGKLPLMQGDSSSKHHRLEHRIVLDAEEEEGEGGKRRWSEAEAADTLYLGSEMIMEECGSGSGVINGRSVSEITGVNRSNNGGSKREKGEGEGVMRRWVSWISQSQHQQSTAGNSAASSSTSAIV